jgi:hypothetical protein
LNLQQQAPAGGYAPPPTYAPYDPRGKQGRNNVLAAGAVIVLLLFGLWRHSEGGFDHAFSLPGTPRTPRTTTKDTMYRSHKPIGDDTYSFAVAALIRDAQQIAAGCDPRLRSARMLAATGLLFFTVFAQLFLMHQVQKFVTTKWVFNIRSDYSLYEQHMYGQTGLTVNGNHRGIEGYFLPGNFATLDLGLKERVCNIPFSQISFFGVVLLIWTLTCIGQLRTTIAFFRALVLNTKAIQNMKDSLVDLDPQLADTVEHVWVVDGLTHWVRAAIVVFVIIPRLFITLTLLWLGCRFLAATNDFGEMVLNAIALEFILALKDLLYATIVPDRNKREVQKIEMRPSERVDHAHYWSYLGTFSWGIVAVVWIVYYIYFLQAVLPQYRWDVRELCIPFLAERYST